MFCKLKRGAQFAIIIGIMLFIIHKYSNDQLFVNMFVTRERLMDFITSNDAPGKLH